MSNIKNLVFHILIIFFIFWIMYSRHWRIRVGRSRMSHPWSRCPKTCLYVVINMSKACLPSLMMREFVRLWSFIDIHVCCPNSLWRLSSSETKRLKNWFRKVALRNTSNIGVGKSENGDLHCEKPQKEPLRPKGNGACRKNVGVVRHYTP